MLIQTYQMFIMNLWYTKHYSTSFGYDFDAKMNYFKNIKNRMSYFYTTNLLLLFKRLNNIRHLII